MDCSAVRSRLEECRFPADRERVLEAVGEVEVAGVPADRETVATVLARTDERSFASARAVCETVRGTVGEAYVGRKFYDDRSGASDGPREQPVRSL